MLEDAGVIRLKEDEMIILIMTEMCEKKYTRLDLLFGVAHLIVDI